MLLCVGTRDYKLESCLLALALAQVSNTAFPLFCGKYWKMMNDERFQVETASFKGVDR